MPRLPNDAVKYRKRNQISLDGMTGGLQRPSYRGTTKPVQADMGAWGSPPRDYVSPPPQSYVPHPGFADFQEPEYEPYSWEMGKPSKFLHRDPAPSRNSLPVSLESATEHGHVLTPEDLIDLAMDEAVAQFEVSSVESPVRACTGNIGCDRGTAGSCPRDRGCI